MTKIQVLPYSHGEHALLGGSLTLLTTSDDPSMWAYEEGFEAGHLYEDAPAIALIREPMEDCQHVTRRDAGYTEVAQE